MKNVALILLSLMSTTAIAGGDFTASLKQLEKDSRAMELMDADRATSMVDAILQRDYMATRNIGTEPDAKTRNGMKFMSQLAMSGNIVSAQIVARELSQNYGAKSPTFELIQRFVTSATEPTGHDELYEAVYARYEVEVRRYQAWPRDKRDCATVALLGAMYDDDLALGYGLRCAGSPNNQNNVELSAKKLKRYMAGIRQGVNNEN
ncbi:hypothetical protein ACKF11_13835 [Methylobacillus sp. Pita2]|uniref:hypothetical protein n=1 Tax=Methylobacillus sp. Pita2 TaxID=3383245 RepID=UPI0038B512D8